MPERREAGEPFPQVVVTVPTAEEIGDVFEKVYGTRGAEQRNLFAWRLLRCGRKELLFRLGHDQGETLLVTNSDTREEDAVSGETTALYAELKRIIEEHVRLRRIFYTYQLSTKNPAMLAWARSKGNDIFHWDDEISGVGRGFEGADNPTVFVKIFSPF